MKYDELKTLEEKIAKDAHYAHSPQAREESLKMLEVVRIALKAVAPPLKEDDAPEVHSLDYKERKFTLEVTARRHATNEIEGKGWLDPEDFAHFLNERFTVKREDSYGLDAYNKHAGQDILEVKVAKTKKLKKKVLNLELEED